MTSNINYHNSSKRSLNVFFCTSKKTKIVMIFKLAYTLLHKIGNRDIFDLLIDLYNT